LKRFAIHVSANFLQHVNRPKEYTCQFWEEFKKIKVVRLGYPNVMRDNIKPINYDPIEIKINMEFNKVENK